MSRFVIASGLVTLALLAAPASASAQVTYDNQWSYNRSKHYYYKRCTFPAGGYQYLVYFPQKPNWVYWYNPKKHVFWSACPTVNHPRWGQAVNNGQDLFLMATTKGRTLRDTQFPDPGSDGANFTNGTATDTDGSQVELGCPPPDLP